MPHNHKWTKIDSVAEEKFFGHCENWVVSVDYIYICVVMTSHLAFIQYCLPVFIETFIFVNVHPPPLKEK